MTLSDRRKLLKRNRVLYYVSYPVICFCLVIVSIASIVTRTHVWLVIFLVVSVILSARALKIIRLYVLIRIEKIYRDKELYSAEDTEYQQYMDRYPEKTERQKIRKNMLMQNLDLTRTDFHYQTDGHQSFMDYLEKKYLSAEKGKIVYLQKELIRSIIKTFFLCLSGLFLSSSVHWHC